MADRRKLDWEQRSTLIILLMMGLAALVWIVGDVTNIGAIRSLASILFFGGLLWAVWRFFVRDFLG